MLVLCADCRRFVREGDDACPFCGATARAPRERFTRLGRIFVAATAASAITYTACSAYGAPIGPPGGPYVNRDAAPEVDADDAD